MNEAVEQTEEERKAAFQGVKDIMGQMLDEVDKAYVEGNYFGGAMMLNDIIEALQEHAGKFVMAGLMQLVGNKAPTDE